jgi:hypothetical protein
MLSSESNQMKTVLPRLVLWVVFLALGSSAGAKISLDECYGPYRIQSFVKAAAALQALPEVERTAQLRAWAGEREDDKWSGPVDDQVIRLCRMLFERKSEGAWRPAYYGAPHFVGQSLAITLSIEETRNRWPDEPFVFFEDVPFDVVSRGRSVGGAVENAANYLDYCLKRARWTTRDYSKINTDELPVVLARLLEKYPWPEPLTEHDRRYLADQIKPYENPPLWSAVRGSNASDTTHLVITADEKPESHARINGVEKLAVTVKGGARPYRYIIRAETDEGASTVLGQGVGGAKPTSPFRLQEFPILWGSGIAGSWIIFEVSDSSGAQLKQRIKIIDDRSVDVYRPLTGREVLP